MKPLTNRLVLRGVRHFVASVRRDLMFLESGWNPIDEPNYAEDSDQLRLALARTVAELQELIAAPADDATGAGAVLEPIDDGGSTPHRIAQSQERLNMGTCAALIEARKRWGDLAYVRWRRAALREVLGRESSCSRLCEVGRFQLSQREERFIVAGRGSSWEEAFAEADQVDIGEREAQRQNEELVRAMPVRVEAHILGTSFVVGVDLEGQVLILVDRKWVVRALWDGERLRQREPLVLPQMRGGDEEAAEMDSEDLYAFLEQELRRARVPGPDRRN